ncbi:MAG TPA: toxin-antitoxin system YwqK family antitoxin, partial [Chryseolinea sp.]
MDFPIDLISCRRGVRENLSTVSPDLQNMFSSYRIWILLPFLISFCATHAVAQKEMRTYYEGKKKQVQEIFFVSNEDEQKYVGKYQRFYESGGIMLEGNFEDGEKSGVFTEYHENGKPARSINYVNGMRHGAVNVFDEDGKPFQKAYYQNDKLTDSIQLYFDNGNVKRESFFVKGKPDGLVKEYYPNKKLKK